MHVIATAGHVDHGKTTLLRALTGMDADRLADEHRRGMTLDLGYAWTQLPSGRTVAFVDVPGHERFVTTMLAGVGPVPAVLFVVAADEGWRAQSSEHLDALNALGVNHGLLAITRTDLADPDTALAQAREHLRGTSLAHIQSVAVSSTGTGLDELRTAIDRLLATLPTPDLDAPVRLWVDRAFTIRGAGTVVTGTLPSGTIRIGDSLELGCPTGRQLVHVRAIESMKQAHQSVSGVARVALNLRGISKESIERGQSLVTPDRWWWTNEVDAWASQSIPTRHSDLVLHIGSAAVPVRVRPLDGFAIRLRLPHALPLHVHDRGVLRAPSDHHIAAGITILDVDPPPLTRRGAARARAAELSDRLTSNSSDDEVARRGIVRRADLMAMGYSPAEASIADWMVAPALAADLRERLGVTVADYAAAHPLEPGMPIAAAQHALGLPDARIVSWLADRLIPIRDGRLVGGERRLPPAVAAMKRRLSTAPFNAAESAELAALGLTEPALAAAVSQGELLKLASGVYLTPDAPRVAAGVLSHLPQPFTISQARQALRTTRRVAVPLLELLDQRGVTRRIDEQHRVITTP
jgi:selenocysteine-specific elongation factor